MSRRGRRAANEPVGDREESSIGGLLNSPPNPPVPPPIPNLLNSQSSASARPGSPPRYEEVINPRAPGIPSSDNVLGVLQQMIQMMNQNQQATLNTLHDLNRHLAARGDTRRANQGEVPDRILPSGPPMHANIGRPMEMPIFHGNLPNQSNANNHHRTQHLKSSETRIPQYSGSSDSKTPFDFIIELEKYREAVGYTEREMLQYVIPLALTGDASNWCRYEPAFQSWNDFKQRIRSEFQAIGYYEDMRRDLQLRTQGPTEPLTEFIRVIRGYYERIGDPAEEIVIVTRILRNMHPEYKQAFLGKHITTLNQLKQEAHSAQELIKSMRTYKPPSASGGLEPSLSWKPIPTSTDSQKPTSSTMALESNKSNKLHMASVDPFAYHHPVVKKHVTFPGEIIPESSSTPNIPRSPVRRVFTTPPRDAGLPRLRRDSGNQVVSPNNRGCYSCGSTEHFIRDCPLQNSNSPSGNGKPLSPNRR